MAGGRSPEGGLPAKAAEQVLRKRLVDAIAKAAAEHGYEGLTVERVSRYAGVQPATFTRYFASTEQGLVAAFEIFLERLQLEVHAACEDSGSWPAKVRAGVRALLSSLVEASPLARVFAVEAAAASLAMTERQLAALGDFAAVLRDGRSLYPRAVALPEITERVLVGGVASIVEGHLLAEDPQELMALEPQIVELVLAPYLGEAEARRVAAG